MNKLKLYLAGPMRSIPQFNFPLFFEAADHLRSHSRVTEVFNPAERDRDNGFDPSEMTGDEDLAELGFSLREALAADTEYIAKHADAVIVLPGYKNSSGVKAEVTLARALGLPVVEYRDALVALATNRELKDWDVDRFVTAAPAPFASGGTVWPSAVFTNPVRLGATGPMMEQLPNGEVRTVSATGGEKGVKPERFDLIPWEAIAALARHFAAGARKYEDHNWRRGYPWSNSFAALMRHITAFWNGEDIDEETGSPHIVSAMWHTVILYMFTREHPDYDDRFKPPAEPEEPAA